jgi:CHAD domain-containing protein
LDLTKKIDDNCTDLKNKCILNHYQRSVKKITYLHLTAPVENLHSCRKRIKNLLYINKVLPKQVKKKLNINTSYLMSLEENIGIWHDHFFTLSFLYAHKIDKRLTQKIDQTTKKLLNSIHQSFQNFPLKISGKAFPQSIQKEILNEV